MAGAGNTQRVLFSAVTRSSIHFPTSLRASSRIRQIHSRCSNWTPRTPTSSSLPWRTAAISQSVSNVPASALSASIRTRRAFSSSPLSQHGDLDPPKPGEERTVTFIDKEGQSHEFKVSDGDNLLDVAQANDLEMEGACGGSCACSTCHVIVETDHYDAMEEPDDDENDMLDLAFGLTETSRLGCQVKMSKALDGLVIRLPSMTRNMQASDFEGK